MKRPCVFWLHQFHLEQMYRSIPGSRGKPLAMYNGRKKVVLCNREAQARGVRVGMALKEAVALLERLALVPVPEEEEGRVRPLARELLRFSPLVGVWGQEEIVVDLAPSAHLFGGEMGLIRQVRRYLEEGGYSSFAGVGDSLAGARLAARVVASKGSGVICFAPGTESEKTGSIPLEELYSFPEISSSALGRPLLQFLKVTTLAQIRGVLRPGLPALAREWEELRRYAQASAELEQRVERVEERSTYQVDVVFTPPVIELEPILHHLEQAHQTLARRLEQEQALLCSMRLLLTPEDRVDVEVPLLLARPTRDPRVLVELWRLKLAHVSLGRPLCALHLIADQVTPQERTHTELLVRNRQRSMTLAELQNRLQAVLGPEGTLFRPTLRDAFLPEKQVARGSALGSDTGMMEREDRFVACSLYVQSCAFPPFPLHLLNYVRRKRASRVFLEPLPVARPSSEFSGGTPLFLASHFCPESGRLEQVRYLRVAGAGWAEICVRVDEGGQVQWVGSYE